MQDMRNSTLLILIIGLCAQITLVSSVACTSDSDCVNTDNTKGTCSSSTSQCECETDLVPTNEGCANKLPKPTIETDGHAHQAIQNAAINVTCVGTNGGNFEYYTGSNLDQLVTGTLQMGTTDIIVGCKEKGSSADLDSEMSDPLTIAYVTSNAGSATPTINLPADKVASGAKFTPTCTNVPYGVTTAITTDPDTIPIDAGVITQPGSVDPNDKIKCTYSIGGVDVPGEKTFPELFASLDDATLEITSEVLNANGDTAFPTNSEVILKCIMSPADEYRGSILTGVTYSWKKDNQALTGETSAEYKLDTSANIEYTATANKITCHATDASSAEISSSPLSNKIIIQDNYVIQPQLTANPTIPEPAAKVQIKCSEGTADVVINERTVSWTRAGVTLQGQNDRTLQLTNLKSGISDPFVCTLSKDGYVTSSVPLTFNVPAGVVCNDNSGCDENDASLTGTCNVATQRCVCTENYSAKDDKCVENGAPDLFGSLVLAILVAVFHTII